MYSLDGLVYLNKLTDHLDEKLLAEHENIIISFQDVSGILEETKVRTYNKNFNCLIL